MKANCRWSQIAPTSLSSLSPRYSESNLAVAMNNTLSTSCEDDFTAKSTWETQPYRLTMILLREKVMVTWRGRWELWNSRLMIKITSSRKSTRNFTTSCRKSRTRSSSSRWWHSVWEPMSKKWEHPQLCSSTICKSARSSWKVSTCWHWSTRLCSTRDLLMTLVTAPASPTYAVSWWMYSKPCSTSCRRYRKNFIKLREAKRCHLPPPWWPVFLSPLPRSQLRRIAAAMWVIRGGLSLKNSRKPPCRRCRLPLDCQQHSKGTHYLHAISKASTSY